MVCPIDDSTKLVTYREGWKPKRSLPLNYPLSAERLAVKLQRLYGSASKQIQPVLPAVPFPFTLPILGHFGGIDTESPRGDEHRSNRNHRWFGRANFPTRRTAKHRWQNATAPPQLIELLLKRISKLDHAMPG